MFTKYSLTLYKPYSDERTIYSHVYGDSLAEAINRVMDTFNACPDIWEGWHYKLYAPDGELVASSE
jgi:hypothetical protein